MKLFVLNFCTSITVLVSGLKILRENKISGGNKIPQFEDISIEAQISAEDDSVNSILALRINQTCLLVNIKQNSSGNRVLSLDTRTNEMMDHLYQHESVGKSTDCIATYRLINEIELSYGLIYGIPISPRVLASQLAQEVHERSLIQSNRLWSVNTLLVDRSTADIYKIDLSGTYHICNSISIGRKSSRINHWLATRGSYLHQNTNFTADSNDTIDMRTSIR